jgi:hypothetical protein
VTDGALFTMKAGAVVVVSNLVGALFFWRVKMRRGCALKIATAS